LGKKWIVRDRYGDTVYLTNERWHHILENHPEMENYSYHLKETNELPRRKRAGYQIGVTFHTPQAAGN